MEKKLFDEKLAKCKEKLAKSLADICSALKTDQAKEAFKRSCYVAGGAIWSTFNEEDPNDYDIFCRNKDDLQIIIKDLGDPDYATDNADTYTMTIGGTGYYVQFVEATYGTPDKVIEQFDFKHNMFAFDCLGDFFSKDDDFLINKHLVVNELNKGDLNTVICRVPKFCARGFDFSDTQMAELLLNLKLSGGIDEDVLKGVLENAGYDPRSFDDYDDEPYDHVEPDTRTNESHTPTDEEKEDLFREEKK